MPSKGKGQKLEVEGGAKASKGGASLPPSKQEKETLNLDEITRACLEIDEQVARQESRPKNRKKKAARQKNEVEKASAKENKEEEKEKETEGGEGVQQLCELNMSGEGEEEATRLTELIKISVEVSSSTSSQY